MMTCIDSGDISWAISHYAAIGALIGMVLSVVTWVAAMKHVPGARTAVLYVWSATVLCFVVMFIAGAIHEHPLLSLCAGCVLAGVILGAILGWVLRGEPEPEAPRV